MHTAYLSAGSNLGNRQAHLERAVRSLKAAGIQPRRISSIFETEPVGFREQPWFLNVVLEVETLLTPDRLLASCQSIEAAQGRVRSFRNAPRTLDLDILLYEETVLNDPRLVIPHPRLTERRFVLEPLAEIAPDALHPVLKKTIRSLLEACPDSASVRPFSPGGLP